MFSYVRYFAPRMKKYTLHWLCVDHKAWSMCGQATIMPHSCVEPRTLILGHLRSATLVKPALVKLEAKPNEQYAAF
jgi:hypothetical protein